MWIERLMAGISHQHVLSYNPRYTTPTLHESGAYLLNARSVSNSYVISSKIVVVGMWEKKQV